MIDINILTLIISFYEVLKINFQNKKKKKKTLKLIQASKGIPNKSFLILRMYSA